MNQDIQQENPNPKEVDSPPQPRNIDFIDLLGWLTKYLGIPIIPFLVGALIRCVEYQGIKWESLDPIELSFSFALYCLLIYVSARSLERTNSRNLIEGLFLLGSVIFISLFGISVSKSAQFLIIQRSIISDILAEVNKIGSLSYDEIVGFTQVPFYNQLSTHNIIVLIIDFAIGFLYICLGIGFRHFYNLGDE